MPELAKYHTFNTVIIGAGVALRWRGYTGRRLFRPWLSLRTGGKTNARLASGFPALSFDS